MKKVVFLLIAMVMISQTVLANIEEKVYAVPNATASLVNKVAEGTNDNATALVGGVNTTLHNVASDLNEFGKDIYTGILGGTIEDQG